jgi:hypothetical protein
MPVHIPSANVPIKAWTEGVPVEDKALDQLRTIAGLPFIYKHVAAMPDVHWGLGATIGSVIATKGAVIPAAVGVDIGCGMSAQRTTLTASDLPDDLSKLRSAIEAAIPHGRTDNGGPNDKGAWAEPTEQAQRVFSPLSDRLDRITSKHQSIRKAADRALLHAGTLGGGNHFVEVCLDEDQRVWIMLHSGSRGVGNKIGTYFIEKARKEMERYFINLPDKDLAYLVDGSELFGDYVLMDITATLAPKSDQLNSDDLIAGPRTITVTKVSAGSVEQPVAIAFEGDNNKPWYPCKSMRRVLVAAWGADSSQYIGRRVTLFRDPSVTYGSIQVGGIRVSHLSHLDGPLSIALTVTRQKRTPYRVQPLAAAPAPAVVADAEQACRAAGLD